MNLNKILLATIVAAGLSSALAQAGCQNGQCKVQQNPVKRVVRGTCDFVCAVPHAVVHGVEGLVHGIFKPFSNKGCCKNHQQA